ETTPFHPANQIIQESRSILTDLLTGKDIRNRMEQGFSVLMRELNEYETPIILDGIQAEWVKYSEYLLNKLQNPPEQPLSQEEALEAFDREFPISDDTIERFYQCGYRLYQDKNYQEAADVFFVISSIDYRRHNVWMILGLSEEKLNNYEQALVAFSMATLTDMENPLTFLHSAECYLALTDNENAQNCLQSALNLVNDKSDKESQQIKSQIISLQKTLLGGN
ncbi:MAG: hypothetical protein JSS09_09180, partial [Verrucomicrobia bacterium]|nr:hypothetical protein [Verrucomicrobiota bacterium]